MKMKLFIAATLASSLVSPAVAGDYYEERLLCAVTAEAANAVMLARQAGVSMSEMMNIAEAAKPAAVAEMGREMVLDAFARKKEHTEEDQQRVVEAFESAAYLQCTRELRAESK